MENNTLCNRHSLGVNNHTKMYVTYTRIYGWSDYGGESSYQPGYRLENMMWMTLLVYDYIIPGEKKMPKTKIQSIVFTAMMVFCMVMFPDSTFTANIFCRSICTSDVQKCIQWRRDGVPESDGQQDCQYI